MDPAEIRRRELPPARRVPADDADRRELRLAASTRRRSTRRSKASGYTSLRAEQAKRRASGDPKLLGIGVVVVRRGDRARRPAHRVRRGRDPRRRHGEGLRRHERPRPGPPRPRSRCSPATSSASRWTRSTSSTPTPTECRAVRARWARVRCRPRAARSTSHRTRCSSRAQKIAAHLLEASPDDIVAGEGGVHVAGVPANALSWADLAVASRDASKLPSGLEPAPLRHELDFDGSDSTYPFGSHVSVVEVDTETGEVTMLRHVAVDDCGRILNPMLVERPAARWHRPGRCAGAVRVDAVRRRRQPAHVDPRRLRHAVGRGAAAASRCRTRRPTALATRSARRASASRARSARHRRSTTPSSTRSATSASRTSTCRAPVSASGARSRRLRPRSKRRAEAGRVRVPLLAHSRERSERPRSHRQARPRRCPARGRPRGHRTRT